ncbi:MAG: GAF domain-containing protein [Bdellovibrionota bacterium]
MQSHASIRAADRPAFYHELRREIEALLDPVWFTALANASASLKHHLTDINWVGFYLFDGKELVLGPFQGLSACTRIALDRGVCGAAARERKTFVVEDVHAFPGHIACDSASRSEIVVPIVVKSLEGSRLVGVLDVDSPTLARFVEDDRRGLEAIVESLAEGIRWPKHF